MHPNTQIAVHRYLPKTVHCYLPTTPDEFFASNSHLLKYSLVIERLKVVSTDKVIMPDWLKKLNKK